MAYPDTHRTANPYGEKQGDLVALGLLASTVVYKGDVVRSQGSSATARTYCTSGAAVADYDQFAGVAIESITAGAVSGVDKVRAKRRGIFPFYKTSPAYTDIGAPAFTDTATDPQTVVTTTTTHSCEIGTIVGFDATLGIVWVDINIFTAKVAA